MIYTDRKIYHKFLTTEFTEPTEKRFIVLLRTLNHYSFNSPPRRIFDTPRAQRRADFIAKRFKRSKK